MSLKSVALCVAVMAGVLPTTVPAQSASKVIERHIEAIGGEKAVEKIVSTELSGRVRSSDGRSGVFTQRTKRPLLFSVNLSWGDSRWRAGFNGRSAWREDGVDGLRTLYGEDASRVRAEARYANTRLSMPEKVNRVSVMGRDEVRGRPVIILVALMPDGMKRTLFFDANSYLLVKDEQQTDAGVEERFYDDYRPVDQIVEPHRIEWHRGTETYRIDVERVTHNASLDEQVFDVPATPAEPPLEIDALLSTAVVNEQRAESVRTSYAYTQALTVRIVDKQGNLTQREASAFDVFHLGGQPVGRLIRRLGKPLSEAERRSEDERVKGLVREYERQRLAGRTGPPPPPGLDASSYVLRNLWGSLVLRVPVLTRGWFPAYRRISDFTNVRRERLQGRAVAVIEFQPKGGVAPNDDVERQAALMAGTFWIDEASQQLIRIESYFFDDYDSIVQGSSVWMEQTFVNGEVWLPSRIETNLRRSLNFGALAQPLTAVQFTNHKKFNVESDFKTLP